MRAALLDRPQRTYPGYVFDLDGTVYLGDAALPGAVETLARIRAAGDAVCFVTNNPLHSAEEYAARLEGVGVEASTDDVVTSVDSLLAYLQERHRGAAVLPVAEDRVCRALRDAGFELTEDPSYAEVVVAAFDRTFDYDKLTRAYQAVRLHGAVLVGTNPDPFCPTPGGGLPDCAAVVAAIEACTGVRAEAVVGKPSPVMVDVVAHRLGVPVGDLIMVGDRLDTDMQMAERAGMAGVLVLTGATRVDDLDGRDDLPAYVIPDLTQLLPDLPTPEGPTPERPR
jgi:NagD protein